MAMTALERAVSVSAFPVVFGGSLLWAVASMEDGTPPNLAVAGPMLVPMAIVLVLERLFPHHRSWLRNRGDVRVDLCHAVSVSLTSGAASALTFLAIVPGAAWLAARFGAPLWPAAAPWWAQLVLALVVAELPKYWLHRCMHENDFLWRFHATHHSPERLYFLNATRFHPIDIGLDAVVGLAPLVLLGVTAEAAALFTLVSTVHGFFQHANLKLRLGPLNHFFSMAELHRWHHSRTVEEANHNYGQNVIVWDTLFGTRFLPKDREPPEHIGIPDLEAFPQTYWRQLASPFRWQRIRAASDASAQSSGSA